VAHHHFGDLPRKGGKQLAEPLGSIFSAHMLLDW
jgi:isocitrate/isopropylmalate dehydrogenase